MNRKFEFSVWRCVCVLSILSPLTGEVCNPQPGVLSLLVDLDGFLRQHVLFGGEHLEHFGEVRESGTEMHVILKLLKHLRVVKVGMRE